MNNPPSAPELLSSSNLHGPAIQLLRLVTPPPLAGQTPTLLQDQGEPSFHQDHGHDRHRSHLCSYGSISPTVQPLDFSVHVISHTGPYARSSERRHEQRVFGQLSEIPVVVPNLIDFLQVPVPRICVFPYHSCFFKCDCNFWQRRANSAMLGVPSNLIFTMHCLNYTSHGKTYSSSVLFCVSLHFLHCAQKN